MICAKKLIAIMKRVVWFISKGFNTLSASSQGKYSEKTDDIKKIRNEMLSSEFGSFRTDKENLMRDKRVISGDVYRAFSNLVAE